MRNFYIAIYAICFSTFAYSAPLSGEILNSQGQGVFGLSAGALVLKNAQRQTPDLLDLAAAEDLSIVSLKNGRSGHRPSPNSALADAFNSAWKKDFVQDGIEGTKKMLLDCQRETSVALTTPLMRSDAQQAHCFRF